MSIDGRPWRCFVGVPISHELRAALGRFVGGLRRTDGADADWRWTDDGGWHVTLAFLGQTDAVAIPGLATSLERLGSTFAAFPRRGGGLGTFPSPSRARVLWYGIGDRDGQLHRLARAVQEAMGLEPEDRFRGHLTLARARDRAGADASRLLAGEPPPTGEIAVDRLVLFRSHLGRGPARYQELASVALAGATA